MKTHVDLYGCLTKVENLWCLEHYGIPNTCILQSLEEFPGYYTSIPSQTKPMFVYIVLGKYHTLEDIMRITKEVRKEFKKPFDVARAEINFRGQVCCAVRIAQLEDYSYIRELQETYKNNGLELRKKVKNIENEEAIIKIRKFFNLVEHDDVYIDTVTPDIGYFKVNCDLPWDQFEKNIKLLRSNCTAISFDAAKCFIYKDGDIIDLIRIYSKGITLEYLNKLKNKYYMLFPQHK